MAQVVPSTKINPNACTPEQMRQNWTVLQEYITYITTTIEEGSTTDTYKLKIVGTDTADFLHVKVDQSDAMPDTAYVPVSSYTVAGDETERWYWDSQDVTGWDATITKYLAIVLGVPTWSIVTSGADDKKVMVTGGDTPSYLHEAFHLNDTYIPNADILIATATVDETGGEYTERLFVDVSIITNHHDTERRLLGLIGGDTEYFSLDQLVDELADLLAAHEDFLTEVANQLQDQYRMIRGLAKGVVLSGADFVIDNVVPLARGLDPSSGLSGAEIDIVNLYDDAYADNERVIAVWNHQDTQWESLPRRATSDDTSVNAYRLLQDISAAADDGNPGSGYAIRIDSFGPGGAVYGGSPALIFNYWGVQFDEDSMVVTSGYIIDGSCGPQSWVLSLADLLELFPIP